MLDIFWFIVVAAFCIFMPLEAVVPWLVVNAAGACILFSRHD